MIIIFMILASCIGVGFAQIDFNYENALNFAYNGDNYAATGQFDEAIEQYNKSIEVFQLYGDDYNKAIALSKLGVIYAKKNEPDNARKYLQESYNILQNDGIVDEAEIAVIGNLGKVFLDIGDFDKSYELFSTALSWSEERNNTHNKALSLANIGGYYREIEDYDTALEYHIQAAGLFNKSGDGLNEGGQIRNIGIIYYFLNDFQNSIYYYDEAELIYIENNYDSYQIFYLKSLSYNAIANRYKKQKNLMNLLNIYMWV